MGTTSVPCDGKLPLLGLFNKGELRLRNLKCFFRCPPDQDLRADRAVLVGWGFELCQMWPLIISSKPAICVVAVESSSKSENDPSERARMQTGNAS